MYDFGNNDCLAKLDIIDDSLVLGDALFDHFNCQLEFEDGAETLGGGDCGFALLLFVFVAVHLVGLYYRGVIQKFGKNMIR